MSDIAAVEAKLRAGWDADGVPVERQNEMLAEITRKARPGARIGPLMLSIDGAQILMRGHAYDIFAPSQTWQSVIDALKLAGTPYRIKAAPSGRNYGWIVAA